MFSIGIDIGGTYIKYGIVKEDGTIIFNDIMRTLSNRSINEIINDIGNVIEKLEDITKKEYNNKINTIGIGIPGIISRKSGIVKYSPNLKWENVEIVKLLKKYTNKKIIICNDAKVATIAENYHGSGKHYNNFIMLTIGTGIGAGVILDKKLYEGNEETGGELGHQVIVVDGEQCNCSRKGCLEAYVSIRALVRDTLRKMEENKDSIMWKICDYDITKVDGRIAFEAAKKEDKSAKEVVNNYIKYLGEGILNICNIFRPEAIILGGGMSETAEYLIDNLKEYISKRDYGYKNSPKVEILKAKFENKAGIIGAAMLGEMFK